MKCGHGFDRCAHVLPWTSQNGNPLPSDSNPICSVCCGIEPDCVVLLGLREIWMQGVERQETGNTYSQKVVLT